MVLFFNSFISYLIVVIVFFAVIVCGVLAGKKLRDNKDKKAESAEKDNNDAPEGDK